MFLHTEFIEPKEPYRLVVRFNDGTGGEIDLAQELWGEMFAPLRDQALFLTARQDEVMGTVVWDNGADLAPEYLKDLLKRQANNDGSRDCAGQSHA